MMKVHLLRSSGVPINTYQGIVRLLGLPDHNFEFKAVEDCVTFQENILNWDLIFKKCTDFRIRYSLAEEDFVILLTEKPNSLNWFSACDPGGARSIFIHTDDWEYYVPCGAEHPIAYEVIENILERLMFQDIQAMVEIAHDEPRGCINDMCSQKRDIILKLRTADICSDCLDLLDQQNISFQLIQRSLQILESIRENVLYSSRYRQSYGDDQHLPFPVAITLRKLKNTQDPLRKFLYLLDHFDSLVRSFILLAGPVMLGDKFADFYQVNGLNLRPSLGHWVTTLQSLSNELRNTDIYLGTEILNEMKEVKTFCDRDHIVNLRNDRRGHGYIDPNNQAYTNDFEKYRPVVQEIEKRFSPFFSKYKMYQVLNSGRINAASFLVTALDLMGSHPDFAQVEVKIKPQKLEEVPIVNQVYLNSLNGEVWIQVSPYILYSDCPECHHPRVLVADGEKYIDPYIGHRVNAA